MFINSMIYTPTDKEIEEYITKYNILNEYEDYIHNNIQMIRKIYLSFFIDYVETTLDMNIVNELGLIYYDEPKKEQWSNDEKLEAKPFKYMQVSYVDLETKQDSNIMKEMKKRSKYELIKQCKTNIRDILKSKTIIEPNIGICNECEDCQGHRCGDIIYHILGFAGRYVQGNKLNNVRIIK